MAPTVDLKTSFTRPATVGTLFVEGRVVHRGRDMVFLDGAMKDKDAKCLPQRPPRLGHIHGQKRRGGARNWRERLSVQSKGTCSVHVCRGQATCSVLRPSWGQFACRA